MGNENSQRPFTEQPQHWDQGGAPNLMNPAIVQQLLEVGGQVQRDNAELRAQLATVVRDPAREAANRREAEEVASFQPFSEVVAAVQIPDTLKTFPWILYGGDRDPRSHLKCFNGMMVMYGAADLLSCRIFPFTFKDAEEGWFNAQAPGSIINFTDFSSRFLAQFSTCKAQKVTLEMLLGIRQLEGEPLRQYVSRFAAACIPLEKEQPVLCVSTFKSGLQLGPFNNDLNRTLPKTFQELKARSDGFIADEDEDMNKRAISFQSQPTKTDKGRALNNEPKAKQDNSRPFYAGRQDRRGPYQGKTKAGKWERQ